MSVVKINAISVPDGAGEVLEERFAARADSMKGVAGFLGFDLLRPTGEESRYFVYTRWEDEAAFEAWRSSDRAGEAHAGAQQGGPVSSGAELLEFEVVLSVAADGSG
ncbi:MAG: antibiotic biosynthesis monooxygenase [Actinomycetota bacterium]